MKKIIFFIFFLIFFLFQVRISQATPVIDNVAGTFVENFTSAVNVIAARSFVNVNEATGKLQLASVGNETTFTTPLRTSGYAILNVIKPLSVAKWGTVTLNANIPEGTSLNVQVADGYVSNGRLFSENYLPGNSTGISTFPIDLSAVPVWALGDGEEIEIGSDAKTQTIQLKILMTTNNSLITPEIDSLSFDWTVSQGDLTDSEISDAPWAVDGGNQQNTNQSRYVNSEIYPAFRWASSKYEGNAFFDKIYVLNESLFGWTSYVDNKMFSLDRDNGNTIWEKAFNRGSGPRGFTTQNGTWYGTEMGSDLFYVIDTSDGKGKWSYNFFGGHGNGQITLGNDGTIFTIRSLLNQPEITLYAFGQNGAIKWTRNYTLGEEGDVANISPLTVGEDGTLYYIYSTYDSISYATTNHGRLVALDPVGGDVLWETETDGNNLSIYGGAIIDTDETIFVFEDSSWSDPIDRKIYAVNSADGSIKWKKSFGIEMGGISSLALRNDGKIWVSFIDSFDENENPIYKTQIISKTDGALISSKDALDWSQISFSDNANGVFLYGNNTAGFPELHYYNQDNNLKWKIVGDGIDLQSELTSYNFSQFLPDERGWIYGGFIQSTVLDLVDYEVDATKTFTQPLAIAPWTAVVTVDKATYRPGENVNFSLTTSMQEENPLFEGTNQVQIILSNEQKIPLVYSSTKNDGDTVWTGSYNIPTETIDGSINFTVELNAAYVETDIPTHFEIGAVSSGNTGINKTGSFQVEKDVIEDEDDIIDPIEENSEEEIKNLDIYNIAYSSNQNSITINWKTNNEADSKVKYGISENNLNQSKKDNDDERRHRIIIKDLQLNTKYYFKIYSKDINGDSEKTKTYSITTKKSVQKATSTSNINISNLPLEPKKENQSFDSLKTSLADEENKTDVYKSEEESENVTQEMPADISKKDLLPPWIWVTIGFLGLAIIGFILYIIKKT